MKDFLKIIGKNINNIKNRKETKNALRKHKDGRIWLHTGDIGCMNERGIIIFINLLFFKNFKFIKSGTMNVFLVDLTHGGVKISSELAKSKKYEKVIAYDLYNTLKKEDESLLNTYTVHVIKDLDSFKNELENNNSIKLIDHISCSDMIEDEKNIFKVLSSEFNSILKIFFAAG